MAKVGIIGGGGVGQALCGQLLKKGRSVCFGSRDPAKLKGVLADKQLTAADAVPVAEAVSKSDIIILAVPGRHCVVVYAHWRSAAVGECVALPWEMRLYCSQVPET